MVTDSRSVAAWAQGLGRWEDNCKAAGRNFVGVMEKFYILIVVVITQVYIHCQISLNCALKMGTFYWMQIYQ